MTSALAVALGQHAGLAGRLVAEHVDDGRGRCARCALGAQRGFHTWPCTIYRAAVAAQSGDAARHDRQGDRGCRYSEPSVG